MRMMMKMKNGSVNRGQNDPFQYLFDRQKMFQRLLLNDELPKDNREKFALFTLALVEEIGEVLDTDKRWKIMRKTKYNKIDKINEIADCFIHLINICLYSGFDAEEVFKAIDKKININFCRMVEEKGG
jgi:NTP pyrophosphatase (non-canonical NTP hydrolase)